ncbi:MAG: CNNM domain-containing protein, partial [Chloroflexota bacterium]
MISPLWVIVALAAMLVIDLIAFTARAAFQQVTHARLLGLREGGDARLKRALALLPVMPRLRSSLNLVLVGTRFGIAGLVIWFVLLRPVGQYTPLAAALGLAAGALITFWLEWAVERIAQRSPEATAMDLGGAARILMAISSPWLSPLALGTEAQAVIENQGGVTQDELKTLVDAGEEEGVLQVGEKRMIYSVFELSNTVAREVMVPRI